VDIIFKRLYTFDKHVAKIAINPITV